MTPEQEHDLATRIFLDLLPLEGFVRSIKIRFLDDHNIEFNWCAWKEDEIRRTDTSKTFYHSTHRVTKTIESFLNTFDGSIIILIGEIISTTGVSQGEADVLKTNTSSTMYVCIPRVDVSSYPWFTTEERNTYGLR